MKLNKACPLRLLENPAFDPPPFFSPSLSHFPFFSLQLTITVTVRLALDTLGLYEAQTRNLLYFKVIQRP